MATITLTGEQHEQCMHELEAAREALENAETVLVNRIIDTDELIGDLQDVANACSNCHKVVGDI